MALLDLILNEKRLKKRWVISSEVVGEHPLYHARTHLLPSISLSLFNMLFFHSCGLSRLSPGRMIKNWQRDRDLAVQKIVLHRNRSLASSRAYWRSNGQKLPGRWVRWFGRRSRMELREISQSKVSMQPCWKHRMVYVRTLFGTKQTVKNLCICIWLWRCICVGCHKVLV